MRFALNHITTPRLALDQFVSLTRGLGMTEIEIRNDLPDLVNTTPSAEVKSTAERAGVTILSINAVYPFNVWSGELPAKALRLADYAAACGAKALVMCPLNDGTEVSEDDLVAALKAMKPVLDERGLTGLVEPLGFPISSLRTKRKAIEAIEKAGGAGTYKLVHDTFHHHLAGETEFYPAWTGLVHISGVVVPSVPVEAMLDPHRVLVDEHDRLDNIGQIRALIAKGYDGPFSFEPFAPGVHDLGDPKAALAASINYIRAQLKGVPHS